jgi:hypothetical protein
LVDVQLDIGYQTKSATFEIEFSRCQLIRKDFTGTQGAMRRKLSTNVCFSVQITTIRLVLPHPNFQNTYSYCSALKGADSFSGENRWRHHWALSVKYKLLNIRMLKSIAHVNVNTLIGFR